jgi:hypothetical protein
MTDSLVVTIIAQNVAKDTIINRNTIATICVIIAIKFTTFKRNNGNIVTTVIDSLHMEIVLPRMSRVVRLINL